MEAIADTQAELASFALILEEGWTGYGKSHIGVLDQAVKNIEQARSRFEVIADQF